MKKILFISRRSEDADFCAKLATNLKHQLVPVTRPDGFAEALKEDRDAVVFIDVDHETVRDPNSETSARRTLQQVSLLLPPSRIFALADKNIFEIPQIHRIAPIGTYCLRRYDPFCYNWMEKVINHVFLDKFDDLSIFKDPGSKEVKINLTHSGDKNKALQGINNLLSAKQINERSVQIILQAVDELIMNAIFDAPSDDKGRPYQKSTDRDLQFALEPHEEVEVGVVINEDTILLNVRDKFGSFSRERAMALIQKDYTSQRYRTDAFTKSAGLGLHGVIGCGLGLMINVIPKVSTQASVAFPIFKSFKKMRTSFRSFTLNIAK